MKTIIIILGILSVILISVFIISDKHKRNTKFGNWWEKHICGILNSDDSEF